MLLALPIGMLAAGTTWQEATLIESGIIETGAMSEAVSVDWYKIVVPENGTVKVTVYAHGDLGLNYTTLYALDNTNELHSRGYCWAGNEETHGEFTVPSCAPGTYYLETKRDGGEGSYTIGYEFTPTSSAYPDDHEPNDTWEGASLLTSGITTTGHFGYYYWDDMDNVDWYKIVVPENGTVKVTVYAHGTLGLNYTTLYALDNTNELHARGYCWAGNEETHGEFTVPSCAPGTYYLEMKRDGGEGGYTIGYEFTPTSSAYPDDHEPNDTWEGASLLTSGITTTGHFGYYYWDDMDNVDWYKIVVPENGTVKVTVYAHGALGLNYTTLYALDNTNELHSRGYCWAGNEETHGEFTVPNCAPGTYYLETKRDGGEGGYTVGYEFTPTSSAYPDDHEPNNTWENAKLLKRGNTTTGHFGYYYWDDMDDVDWYKIEVPRDGIIKLNIEAHGALGLNYTTLYVLDNANELHSRGYCWSNGNITVADAAPGTYYLEAKRDGGEGGYTLTYNFEQNLYATDSEPNNDKSSALSLAKDATVAGHLGYCYWDNRDEVDWYQLTVSDNSTVTVTYQAEEGLVFNYVTLYDSEDHAKGYAWSNGDGNVNSITVENLEGGTYYLEMKRDGGQGYYLLSYAATIGSVDPQETLPDEPGDDPEPGPGPGPGPNPGVESNTCLIVWLSETNKHYYNLSEQPKITMNNGDFTLTTTNTTVTYKFDDVLKYTLGEKEGGTGIGNLTADTKASVERQSDRIIFTGCAPKSAIRIYSMGGQLIETKRTDDNGQAEVSIAGLAEGVYVVKSDSVTIKIAKR